jgi:hypothetical protein
VIGGNVSTTAPKVLFVGDGWLGSNAVSMANGLRLAGCDVLAIDTQKINRPKRLTGAWLTRKMRGRPRIADVDSIHLRIEAAATEWRPDVLFCFKTIWLDQNRLLSMPVSRRIHYSADDVSNPYNTTSDYLDLESAWDAVVTTKSFNVRELIARGVRNPIYVKSAYDPAWHRRVARRRPDAYTVGFIGNARPDRIETISTLARHYGKSMVVAGPGWGRHSRGGRMPAEIRSGAYGEGFSQLVADTIANLVLLNSDNRDLHTCRTFEVPAAGGLVIAERTSEHMEIYEDGRSALLFSEMDELEDILSRVSRDTRGFEQVAARGYRSIVGGRHSYADRAQEILGVVG